MKPKILLLCLAALGACGEVFNLKFETYADAVANGVVERGWFPAWASDASNIELTYDLDTNRRSMAWNGPPQLSNAGYCVNTTSKIGPSFGRKIVKQTDLVRASCVQCNGLTICSNGTRHFAWQ